MVDFNLPAILSCFLTLAYVVTGDENVNTNALSYDPDTFASGLQKNRNFVMFYAPWCGHCKNLAPTWDALANIYNQEESSPVVIAKVDCTVHTGLCADHDVLGFPTLKLFNVGGDHHKRYSGKRDLQSLKKFILEEIYGVGSPAGQSQDTRPDDLDDGKQADPSKASPVILTDENFAQLVRKGFFFIKFFAPWCGHCKKLAPAWDDLADTYNHDKKVTIAKMDCTQHKIACKQHGVTGYPTLLWFKDGEQIEKYQGIRTHEAFKRYISRKLLAGSGREELPDTNKASQSKVNDLTDETFESHIASNGLVFVKFFAPWCGHCKQLAPIWEQVAKELHGHPVSIAKVDCTQHKTVCENNEIRGYPTLKLFRKGEYVKDYKSVRNFEHIYKFVKRELERHDEL